MGRRGPKTGQPTTFLDRLMFIRAVRDLQDAGTLRAVTLDEIREVMSTLDAEAIARLSDGAALEAPAVRVQFVDPDWDTSGPAVAVERIVDGRENTQLDAWGQASANRRVAAAAFRSVASR